METIKLYEQDPMMHTFSATVVDCQETAKGILVVLDQTAFYPEGGGQAADHGTISGVHVGDVREQNGVIYHTCDASISVGTTVTGTLDWARRFDHMQHHSGEHILSGILCHDYTCDNVGFHMGTETVTIDYNADISWEQALLAQEKANAIIWTNAPVEINYPDAPALEALSYRSKKALTGNVRIVTFPQADCCACCGTHVVQAGQVGLIKVLSCQKFRGGVRIELVCGQRAMAYFEQLLTQNRTIGQQLSVKPLETATAVFQQSTTLATTNDELLALETKLFARIAKDYEHKGDVVLFQETMSSNALRRLTTAVAGVCDGRVAVFAGEDGRYGFGLSLPQDAEFSPFVKSMNTALSGRGGGKDGFAMGSVATTKTEIENFFQQNFFK